MKTNFTRNIFILIMIGCGIFMYFDPYKPSDEVAKATILASMGLPENAAITEFHKGRSFKGRHLGGGDLVRVWPVTATVFRDFLPRPTRSFLIWKEADGTWRAEVDTLLERRWENRGYFGLGWFGL